MMRLKKPGKATSSQTDAITAVTIAIQVKR